MAFFCKLAGLFFFLLPSVVSAEGWPTTSTVFPATTVTITGFTETEEAYTATYSDTTFTRSPTTIVEHPTTVTFAEFTEVNLIIPEALETLPISDDILGGLGNFAPQITSLPVAVASKLGHDLDALQAAYSSAHPEPTIIGEIFHDINQAIPHGDDPDTPVINSILDYLGPFAEPSDKSVLANLISAYPTLSAPVAEYESVAASWEAPLLLAQGSVVSSDLSLTTAPPSWVSYLSKAAATATGGTAGSGGTSTSSAGAAHTGGVSVLINAGMAAAGMAALAVL